MKTTWKRGATAVAVGLAATAGVLVVTPAQAAQREQTGFAEHCLLTRAGEQPRCAASEAALRTATGGVGFTALVTVYERRQFNTDGDWKTWYAPAICSGPTSDIDYVFELGLLAERVSSVKKYAAGHCNWQLVGPSGGRSTWVEGSWENLANLGGGWEDRAVRIRLT